MSSFASLHLHRVLQGIALLVGLASAFSLCAAPPPAPGISARQDEVWRKSADLLIDDALDSLPPARSLPSDAERREYNSTRGILLLNSQPKLQRNIDEARTLLESVRQVRGDDDLGLSALYYLARIAEFHTDPRDPAKAIALYNDLIAQAPGHPLAQAAVSKLAILRLYDDVTPPERRARLDGFEAAADRLSLPSARRDLHFVLASALINFTDDLEGGLRHLLAAEEAGIVRRQLYGETLIRIALLARQLGHRDVAIAHYKQFVSLFQRDNRTYLLTAQLKELESQGTPVPSSAPAPDQTPPPVVPAASALPTP